MRYIFLITLFCLFLISCSKDSSQQKPTLTFESVNTTVLERGQYIQFTLGFTDPTGQFKSDSAIYVRKVVPQCPEDSVLKDWLPLPAFNASGNTKGDILVTYAYGTGTQYLPIAEPKCGGNDTCFFQFVLQNAAGNMSDTVKSPTIVIVAN
ncbi:hypothetical protein [Ferruginibacter albus]|uniref:hypothetical protein n=1 Tax=Ferruginibacter albus TaxID=2875540 RepID=UPI001CC4C407|nr:hypothetical protein [Ferruginibacter albus]UAY52900.1 hypothetical protein K9M53_04280 [Ferruginibacter albus]